MSVFEKPWGNYLIDGIVETTPPDMVSLWPQSTGWQCVFALLIMLAVNHAYKRYMEYKRNAYRRDAAKLLNQLKANADDDQALKKLPALLRTTALYAFDRTKVSELTGSAWEAWLDQQCPDSSFSTKFQGALQQLAFSPRLEMNSEQRQQLIEQVLFWVTNHRSEEHA